MTRKVPIRKCVGCQERISKRELIRIVRSPNGEYLIDPTGKKPGRGAYICPKVECLEKALKNKGLERSFKSTIDLDIIENLRSKMSEHEK